MLIIIVYSYGFQIFLWERLYRNQKKCVNLRYQINYTMKRILLCIIMLCALCVGCGKDEIRQGDVVDTTGGGVDVDTTGTGGASLEGYDRSVSIVFSPQGVATVQGTGNGLEAQVSGNEVTITHNGSSRVAYFVTGSCDDGYLKIYSGQEQALVLEDLTLPNLAGAAINIQGPAENSSLGVATKVVLRGSNRLADGSTYTRTPALEDEKAVLFSEGGLVLTGTGRLDVDAVGKGGITSDSYVHVAGTPTIGIEARNGHAIRGKAYVLIGGGTMDLRVSGDMKKGITSDTLVRFDGGTTTIAVSGGSAYDTADMAYGGAAGVRAGTAFEMNGGHLAITSSGRGGKGINSNGNGTFSGGTVEIDVTGSDFTTVTDTVSAKGIKFQGNMRVAGGNVSVRCSHNEGVETKGSLTISSGELYSYSATSNAVNAKSSISVSGGYLCGHSDANDGLDAGGNISIAGGVVYAICTDGQHKAINSGRGYSFTLRSGTLVAIGGLENSVDLRQSCQKASTWSANTWHALATGNASYAFKTPVRGSGSLVVSSSGSITLTAGVTTSGGTQHFAGTLIENATVSGGSPVALSAY